MSRLKRGKVILGILALITLIIVGLLWWNFYAKRITNIPETKLSVDTQEEPIESIAKNLEIPWSLDFLPDGSIIFTERQGRVRLIDKQKGLLPEPILTIDEVKHTGEGGLLGITLHPDFEENQYVYLYYTYEENGATANKVVRYKKQGNELVEEKTVFDKIPGAGIHDGGRIKFGPDKLLYLTTGDSANSDLSQDKNSLAGKILRIKDDGGIPEDNPFPNSPVYSYGHRNPQGLAWDEQGRLWATEHGSSATDELNMIKPGRNYGWPVIKGEEKAEGMESPIIQSGETTWAPTGMEYYKGALYFTGLRGQGIYKYIIEDETLNKYFDKKFGRIRTIELGPDGYFYILTNNRDGRGLPTAEDDQMIKIDPKQL